jgi:alpha-ribazole phosphatase
MTRLLLIRHGTTAWNAERRYQGQTDTTLNEDGREQVMRLAERLRSEKLDALYASDLQRAWETAKRVVERVAVRPHLTVQPDPRLREISFGEWEGKTHEEIAQDDPESLNEWFDDPMHRSPPGGETLQDVVKRVEAAYDHILKQHPDQTVAIVAHGGTLRVLLCLALDVRPEIYWRFRFDVASLSELNTYDGGVVLNVLNDTSHLRLRQGKRSAQLDLDPGKSASRDGLILVLGGARSGKSTFAQRMVEDMRVDPESSQSSILFVATAEPGDEEMERRIERHRQARPNCWCTLEAPRNVGRAILDVVAEQDIEAVLVDCMTLLTSNLLMDAEDIFAEETETAMMDEVEELIVCARQISAPFVVVSNEVGWGLVPSYPLGRAYRDLLGRANQALADAADEVILLVAGIPRVIKGRS